MAAIFSELACYVDGFGGWRSIEGVPSGNLDKFFSGSRWWHGGISWVFAAVNFPLIFFLLHSIVGKSYDHRNRAATSVNRLVGN